VTTLVAVQLSVPGLYLPPVFRLEEISTYPAPDIIFTVVHMSVEGDIDMRRVSGTRVYPCVRGGIVPPAGVR